MCTEGQPNNNDLLDGECFWGYVTQAKKVKGVIKELSRWVLLKYSKSNHECFFMAEEPTLTRVSRSQCKEWSPITPPIMKPKSVA